MRQGLVRKALDVVRPSNCTGLRIVGYPVRAGLNRVLTSSVQVGLLYRMCII